MCKNELIKPTLHALEYIHNRCTKSFPSVKNILQAVVMFVVCRCH